MYAILAVLWRFRRLRRTPLRRTTYRLVVLRMARLLERWRTNRWRGAVLNAVAQPRHNLLLCYRRRFSHARASASIERRRIQAKRHNFSISGGARRRRRKRAKNGFCCLVATWWDG
jgi:hypothetical protein